MSALEFDGLLSSHSVFVSPVDRYGQQQHPDQYTHANKVTDDDEGGGGRAVGGDPQWRWAGPAIPGGVDDLVVDHETIVEPRQQQQDIGATSSPERLPIADHDGDSWEDGSRNGGENYGDEADGSWARAPSVDSINDGDTQHGAPSPVVNAQEEAAAAAAAVAASPPSVSHGFEDQPIRGLAGVKEMSLDELIAQGERQMQEAQAKTALLKPPSSSAAATRSTAVAAGRRQGHLGAAPANDEDNKGSRSNSNRSKAFAVSNRWTGQPPETEGPSLHSSGAEEIRRQPRREAIPPVPGGDGVGNGGVAWSGGGGGLRVSLRSGASVGTSWSGGDLSMGVVPAAVAAGGGAAEEEEAEEEESREERERREFYELEMELLREEERGGEPAEDGSLYQHREGGAAAAVGNGGQHRGDFWGDERESVEGGLGLVPAATLKAG